MWYPVPDRRMAGPIAPDVLVGFGRPKGRRGSYKQWEENGVAPQVVFEIRSPSKSVKEMEDKRDFYDPLRTWINTRYGWVASPYPTGTFTQQETPSFTRRDNVKPQKARALIIIPAAGVGARPVL